MLPVRPQFIENAKTYGDALKERAARIDSATKDANAKKGWADAKMNDAKAGQEKLGELKGQYEQEMGTHFENAMQQYGNAKLQSAAGARLEIHVINAVPDTVYQQIWQTLADRGYRLVSFHGLEFKDQTFFDVIFQKNAGLAWGSFHNMSASQYQQQYDQLTSQGYRLAYINSYVSRGQICYAPIFVREPWSTWVAYYGATPDSHQSRFNDLTRQGYRIVNQSIVNYNGTIQITALYDQQNVGAWAAVGLLNSDQYQERSNSNVQQGLSLAYLDTFSVNGQPSFSAIWDSTKYAAGWVARHNMDADTFQSEFMNWVSKGWTTKVLCAYQNGDNMNYAAMWHS
jgi:hypothetical protein